MMALMHNSKQVPAEWQIKAPPDHGDLSCFRCEPEQGILQPEQKQLLKVTLQAYDPLPQCAELLKPLRCNPVYGLM